jgi:hypothetical protein
LVVPSRHAVTDDDGYYSRRGSRRHVAALRANQGGSPITTRAGVEAKEVSARGAGAIASNVLGIEAGA